MHTDYMNCNSVQLQKEKKKPTMLIQLKELFSELIKLPINLMGMFNKLPTFSGPREI